MMLAFLVVDVDLINEDLLKKKIEEYRHIYVKTRALFQLKPNIFVSIENNRVIFDELVGSNEPEPVESETIEPESVNPHPLNPNPSSPNLT